MNLEKIEEMWAKDAEKFFDHRELPECLLTTVWKLLDSMQNTCSFIINSN